MREYDSPTRFGVMPYSRTLLVAILLLSGRPVFGQRAGADWWSLQPVRRPAVPVIRDSNQVLHNAVDAFIVDRLRQSGRNLRPAADRATFIRRLSFDLLGLPPSPDEIADYLADSRPDADARLIDRLLASPRYGERWGRHWLDVARFSESQGFERDKIRDHAWRYRDYVIRSLNSDKPYDRFIREQLAGDSLPDADDQSVIATGFLVAGPWDEAGSGSASAVLRARIREEELEDMISAVSQTFLGLTVNCARCHDHKFDPIPQADYYRIKSVFDGVRHGDRPAVSEPLLRRQREEKAKRDARIADLEDRRSRLETEARDRVTAPKSKTLPTTVPPPIGRWTFDADARDSIGRLHAELRGHAKVVQGRLVLPGMGAFAETAALAKDLREKTLEVWVLLANRSQRGGGVMTVQNRGGGVFDSIVYGERQPGRWVPGSEFYRRTRDLDGPDEKANTGDLVHMVLTTAGDGTVSLYRNGIPYGKPYVPGGVESALRTYKNGIAQVLFGLRHSGAGNGYFAGEIEEARLYDRALSSQQIAASFKAGVASISRADILTAFTQAQRREFEAIERELATLRSDESRSARTTVLAYAANSRQPEPTAILLRGDVEKKAAIVSPGGLSILKSPIADLGLKPDAPEGERRRRFADWVASFDNPLTARVLVNRVWHYHFGRGLVDTPNDFGFNGSRPTHPELLDWLAAEFMAHDWSIKKLHRLILSSAVYRQAPGSGENYEGNPVRRLEAECVRDAMLAVAGNLNPAMEGPGFRPFNVVVFNSSFYNLLDKDTPEYRRRTIYRIGVQSAKDPLLESFDCPEPSVKAPRRHVTTTPLQSLGLMNNPFVLRQADAFASRVSLEADESIVTQVRHAYRIALGREPTRAERDRAVVHARVHGLASLCWVLINSSEFVYVR